jgi:DNA modification methylase
VPFEINKTELVWPGKYDQEGNLVQPPRVSLPFQVIERVNETRATREAKKVEGLTLFEVWDGSKEGSSFEKGWRNKLIWGDNALVMSSLLTNFAGKIDLIYIDPPFDSGADFAAFIQVGDVTVEKEASILEEVAYRDTWGENEYSYLSVMLPRLHQMRELLADSGSLLVHCDYRASGAMRLVLDEVFGPDKFRNELIWNKGFRGTEAKRIFQRSHDTIFWYSKTDSYVWGDPVQPYKDEAAGRYNKVDEEGRRYALIKRTRADGSSYYGKTYFSEEGKSANDVVSHVPTMAATSKERVGYDTQKPLALVEFLIEALSKPGNLVADFFVGSGTTAVASERLGRRWISADLGRFAVHTARKRLLEIDQCKPFEVLNLGSYERQFWSTSNFGHDLDGDGKVNLLEYIAFILKLYGGEPLAGSSHLHGRKGDAYVYVGAVSNPVTITEIRQAVNECKRLEGTAIDVLGWEWEMGLHDPIVGEAKGLGVRLTLKQIPREVMEAEAVRRGQIKFFDLAYLDVKLQQKSNGEVVCSLSDFSTPNSDLIPDEVRQKITNWSDYVDYWAVDWDFQNDTFNHGFVTYRTRQERTLTLQSDPHAYPKAGTYKVLIKVIDIFGNDTSKLVELKVKG